jgi:hypothetical protein
MLKSKVINTTKRHSMLDLLYHLGKEIVFC